VMEGNLFKNRREAPVIDKVSLFTSFLSQPQRHPIEYL
jgi:hypothetical protein